MTPVQHEHGSERDHSHTSKERREQTRADRAGPVDVGLGEPSVRDSSGWMARSLKPLSRHLSVAREEGLAAFYRYSLAVLSEKYLLPRPAFFALSYAQIEPTTFCDLSCSSCISRFWDVPRLHLSLADFQIIIQRLPRVRTIVLQGIGEPLLAPHILDMVVIAARKAKGVAIVTNGQTLNPENAAALESAGCSELVVSIDSMIEALPSRIHAVEHAATALSRAHAALDSGLLRGAMSIMASVSLHPSSIGSIAPTLEAVSAAGIRLVHLDYENEVVKNPQGLGWFQGRPSLRSGESSRILDVAAPVMERLGMTARFGWRLRADLIRDNWRPDVFAMQRALGSHKIGQCRLPWTGIYVTVHGEVTPCCYVPDPAVISFGNILKQHFAEIVRGAIATDLRRSLRDRVPPAFCSSCPCFISKE